MQPSERILIHLDMEIAVSHWQTTKVFLLLILSTKDESRKYEHSTDKDRHRLASEKSYFAGIKLYLKLHARAKSASVHSQRDTSCVVQCIHCEQKAN